MNEDGRPRILLIDDHPLFLTGIAAILAGILPRAVILEASSGGQALEMLAADTGVDWIFLDMQLPDIGGVELLARFRRMKVVSPVIVVSADDSPALVDRVFGLGACGFIPKSAPPDIYARCLRTLEKGGLFLLPGTRQALKHYRDVSLVEQGRVRGGISERQQQVLLLIARGYSNQEIGATLGLSESTVKTHVSSIFKLLGADNRTHCVAEARALGLID